MDPGPEPLDDAPNLPPPFMGFKPAKTSFGRCPYGGMKFGIDRMVNRHLQAGYNQTLQAHGVEPITWSVLEETYRTAEVTFLNGVPGRIS